MGHMDNLTIDKKEDRLHANALKIALEIYKDLVRSNYSEIEKYIYFTGGTSLQIKYKGKFKRFSKDIDFSVDREVNIDGKILKNLFKQVIIELEAMMISLGYTLLSKTDDRKILFLGEMGDQREIKVDFMYDCIIGSEYIEHIDLIKASDLDVMCGKLQRLSPVDIFDIKFLMRQNNYTAEDFFNALNVKSKINFGGTKKIYNTSKYLWLEKSGELRFLKELLNLYENS